MDRETPTDHRLAAYGTLRPGESNHALLAELGGTWRPGTVRGHAGIGRHGSALGFPVLVPDEAAGEVPVMLLESAALPNAWPLLDAFEGPEYERVVVSVALDGGTVDAWLYAARE